MSVVKRLEININSPVIECTGELRVFSVPTDTLNPLFVAYPPEAMIDHWLLKRICANPAMETMVHNNVNKNVLILLVIQVNVIALMEFSGKL
ncbi:MAG: hypothetical protein TIS_04249 [Tissierella sp.]